MVSVTNGTRGAAQATVRLELPEGWTAEPTTAPLEFMNEDESLTVRFTVTVPATASLGEHLVRAVVSSPTTGNQQFASGYQEVDYPHIERRQVIKPAETTFKVMDVGITPDITLGYIVGAGDQVPPALEQLGASVTFIDTDELAWGDLSKYDVIMTGVRAYERRTDLQAYNRRLLDYVERGGTVIVQYNKMEFNQAQYGPYPADGRQRPGDRRDRDGSRARAGPPRLQHSQHDRRGHLEGVGAGARTVLPRREGPAVRGPAVGRRAVPRQRGSEGRGARRGQGRGGPLDLRGPGLVAPAPRGCRRSL